MFLVISSGFVSLDENVPFSSDVMDHREGDRQVGKKGDP